MTPEERKRHISEIAQRLAEELTAAWPEGDMAINDIEDLAARLGHDVQREISDRLLQEEAARRTGNLTGCPCGGSWLPSLRIRHPLQVAQHAPQVGQGQGGKVLAYPQVRKAHGEALCALQEVFTHGRHPAAARTGRHCAWHRPR